MAKTFELLKPEIEELIENRQWAELRELLVELPEPDISDTIERLSERDRIVVLRLLPREMLAKVFSYLEDRAQKNLLQAFTAEEARMVLAGLSPDDRAEFLQALPGQAIQKLLNLLTPEDRRETLQLLGYPEESVGRLMTPDYVAVRPEWTVWVLGFFKGDARIAMIVSLAMISIVIVSSLLGVVLPVVLQRFRVDPAVASNPLIASVMDILGLLIYFSIAQAVLSA